MSRGIPQFILGLLALSAALEGRAAAPNPGSAAPQQIGVRPATAQELNDPLIGKPIDPGVECLSGDLPLEERGHLREANINAKNKSCLPQAEAFTRAAEAASYLAIYQAGFSQYASEINDPARKKLIQDAVKACVNNDPKCDQSGEGRKMRSDLLKALVQYNFGKELKSQVIENKTRAENMKSMEVNAKADPTRGPGGVPAKMLSWQNSLHSAPVKEHSFRLDLRQVNPYDPTKASAQERMLLGKDFNNSFDSFVNEYTSSTGQRGPKSRWHYVEAKTAAIEGSAGVVAAYDYNNLDPRQGKAAIDLASLNQDIKTQDSKTVKDIIESFRASRHDALAGPGEQVVNVGGKKVEKKGNVDAMQLAYEDTGFGLNKDLLDISAKENGGVASPKDVAALVVVSINRAITEKEKGIEAAETEKAARFPSSAGNSAKAPTVPSVYVDMKSFDSFLNDIWPSGVPQPAQSNAN